MGQITCYTKRPPTGTGKPQIKKKNNKTVRHTHRRARKNYTIMRRASEASLCFLGFARKKKPLHNGSYENYFAKAMWWWMLLYRTPRKLTCTKMGKIMYVVQVTPRCAAAATVVSAVVLGRRTKEYTHPYSCLLYTSPSPRDGLLSRMPSSA